MTRSKQLLAVASGGGHWDELMVVSSGFTCFETTYATTNSVLVADIAGDLRFVKDCNRRQPLRSIKCALDVFWLVVSLRPDVIITTGAAPGAMALVFGKLVGARTIWIDGLASADKLSASGRLVRGFADVHLTQWEHLADGTRTLFKGSVL
jgi:hypothetical protein